MSSVLFHGRIFRTPERRTSKAGKDWVAATVKEGQGDATVWWKVICFGDVADELASLAGGDSVAVAGSFKAEIYEKNGAAKVSLTVVADKLISAHRKKKQKENRQEKASPSNKSSSTFDDDIPF